MGLEEYIPSVGESAIDEMKLTAQKLDGKKIMNINSTAVGGGVAEILNRMIPLMRELGLSARWDVIRGGDQFFSVTKKFHNALHGVPVTFAENELQSYWDTQEENL